MQMPPFSTTALSLQVDVSIPFPLSRLESAASYQIALKYLLCG